jgi:hypothetical protein
MKKFIGKILYMIIKAASKCLVAFLIQKFIKRKGDLIMGNTNKTSNMPWWLAILQVGAAVGMSYYTAKVTKNAEWVKDGYRDQLMAAGAGTLMNIATQQVTQMQQPVADESAGQPVEQSVAQQ